MVGKICPMCDYNMIRPGYSVCHSCLQNSNTTLDREYQDYYGYD